MKRRRNILIEVGVVLNFPLAMLGVVGAFSAEDADLAFSIWLAFAALYNMVAYFLLGQRISKLQDTLDNQLPPTPG